jgi:hypothetical protein
MNMLKESRKTPDPTLVLPYRGGVRCMQENAK